MTETLWPALVGYPVLLYVIVCLLKLVNREREERNRSQGMYRELALRVRQVQLEMEESSSQVDPFKHYRDKARMAEPAASTVADVEGI